MKVRCTIGADDISDYLKGYSVSPGGGGIVGSGTFYLDQASGGLDLRVREEVRLWVPFDQTTGVGVAQRGRLFHGLVSIRQTGNVGTTKTWSLMCDDMNALNHLLVRDVNTAKAITLPAGSFASQINTLVGVVQSNGFGAPAKQIDASTGVVDFHPSMPLVTMEPGHSLGWYIQYLCNKARELVPAIRPRFFMGVAQTFGVGDVFGPPVLYVYDGALAPPVSISYSDTPTGAQKDVLPPFSRVTDASGDRVLQRKQALYGPELALIVTSQNTASQGTYPNEWMNHGQAGASGFWMSPPIKLQVNTSAEAQALLDQEVTKRANPTDSFQWTTYELILPYDVVGLKWDLEGIPADTPYRVSKITTRDIRELNPETVLVVNNRRRGLLDDGSDEWPLLPIEGDQVPPLPATSLVLVGQTWSWDRMRAALEFTIGASPSPDTAGYIFQGDLAGEPFVEDVGMNLNPILYLVAGMIFNLQVWAYDHSGNMSLEGTPASPINGTTISAPAPPAPTGLTVVQIHQGDRESLVRASWTHSVQPEAYRDRYELRHYTLGDPARAVIVPVDRAATSVDLLVPAREERSYAIRTVGLGPTYGPWSASVELRPLPALLAGPHNPSFEIGVKGQPSTEAEGWYPDPYGNVLIGRAQGGAQDGIHIYEFTQLSGTGDEAYLGSERFNVQAGRVHNFGVYRKGASDARGDLSVEWFDSSGTYISTTSLWTADQPPAAGAWNHRQASATAPSNAATARLVFFAYGVAGTGEWYAIDNVSVAVPIPGRDLETVGPGAGTYSGRFTVDQYGRVTAVDADEGTAFPVTGLYSGRRFFRTDLGVLCYYDGTRWLGPARELHFYKDKTAITFAGTTYWTEHDVPDAGTYYIRSITWRGVVATTNDGLNFWTLRLGHLNSGLGGNVNGDTNTAAKAAGVTWAITLSNFSNNPVNMADGQNLVLFAEVRKDNGAPGNLTLYGCTCVVHRVYT